MILGNFDITQLAITGLQQNCYHYRRLRKRLLYVGACANKNSEFLQQILRDELYLSDYRHLLHGRAAGRAAEQRLQKDKIAKT